MNRSTPRQRPLHVEQLEDRRLLAVIAEAIAPHGSLIYHEELSDSIAVSGEIDSFTLDLDAGQTLTAVVDPGSSLQVEMQVVAPGGLPIGVATGILGDDQALQSLPISATGTYTVEVSGAASTTGGYVLELVLNAAAEDEAHSGPGNDTFATAQDIDSSFLSLGFGTAERGAVVGALPASTGISVESDDFETGSLGSQWTTFSSDPAGRIQATDSFGAAAGNFALTMDTSVNLTPVLNEAIWTVDLAGVANPTLLFSHRDFFDEEDLLPADFVGSVNGDGVAISDDGVNWHTVSNATDLPSGFWGTVAIDLTAEAAAAGMTLGTNFQVKFQQYDNSTLPSDGRGYDEIMITVPDTSSPEDWYRFGLADGQSASLALTVEDGTDVSLELYGTDGTTLLASGAARNRSLVVTNYVDDTALGVNTSYFARVGGLDAPYSLVVTRDADFDTEGNEELENAQSIALTGTVLGGAISVGAAVITSETEPNDDGVAGGSTADLPLANDWSGSFLPVGGDQVNATLTGGIDVGNDGDWDFFKIHASPGDNLELELRGAPSGLGTLSDPFLWLFDNTGSSIAVNDDFFGLESFISYNGFSYAGDYYVVADSFGGNTGTYTLLGRHTTTTPISPTGDTSYFSFAAVAGDALAITTATPAGGPFDFVNALDPGIEIYDPTGAPVAHNNVAGNEAFAQTAALTGIYSVGVFGDGSSGEYALEVAGNTGGLPQFAATASSPADGERVPLAPTEILVDFSSDVLLPTLNASDLKVDGVDATNVAVVDSNTLLFGLPALVDGTFNVTIAAGAITSLQNQPLAAFASQFSIDTVAPRVISSSLQEGDIAAAGALVYSAQFDEKLDATNLDAADAQLVGQFNGPQVPTALNYNAGTSTLTLSYDNLPEDEYTLTLVSGDGAFEDLAGNDLDGEPLVFPLPPNVSGDGAEGGDFSLQFIATDGPEAFPIPLVSLDPLGSLVYQGDTTGFINYSGDVDEFLLDLDGDQLVSLLVESDTNLTATVVLESPLLAVTATQSATSAGQPVVIESIPTLNSGTYRIRVSDATGGTGSYQLTVLTNSSYEDELYAGVSNDDLGSAEDLSLDFLELGRLDASIASVQGGGTAGPFAVSQTVSDSLFAPNVLTFDFSSIPAPIGGDATLQVTAAGDLAGFGNFLVVDAEGLSSDIVFVDDGLLGVAVTTSITIPEATLAALAADGTISFTVTPTAAVNDLAGFSELLTLELGYTVRAQDWFRFDLDDGQSASIAWEGISSSETAIELYDGGGILLATSVAGTNVERIIANYRDATADGAATSYFARVAGFLSAYQLIVVRGAAFDNGLNGDFARALDISGTEGAVGHVVGAPPQPVSGGSAVTLGVGHSTAFALPSTVTVGGPGEGDEVRRPLLPFKGHERLTPVGGPEATSGDILLSALTAGVPAVAAGTDEIAVLQTFAGPGFTGFIPPDPTAAVGPDQVVAMVNTELAIFDKSTGDLLFQQNLNFSTGFFGSVGATSTIFDPWILFDAETDRFFAMAIDIVGNTSNVFLAVSTDARPTDGDDWHKYKIDFTHDPAGTGLGSGNHFPDYPKMGVSSDAIWISGNYFPLISGSGVYAGITALEKAPLLSGGAANVLYEEHFAGFSVMPMQQYGATNTQYFAEAFTGGGSTITIHAISDVLTTPTRTTSIIAVPTYLFPPDVPQLGGATPADSIDSRIMTGIWRDNSMWFAHAAFDPVMGDGETLVRWYEVATNDFPNGGVPVLVQSGNVDAGPDVHAWMPAINVDAAGHMGIGFALGGPNQYFGAGFTGRNAADPLGVTTFPITEYVVGQGSYANGGFRNRWGDYTALALDPSDEATFWAFNEYAALGNIWATQFASFQIAESATEDWYRFEANSGDILRIETFTPGAGPFEFLNELDPSIEFYDPAGNLVAHTNGIGNELLFHVAAATGTYRLRVFSEDSSKGEYFLQVEGATGGNPKPFVVSALPPDGIPVLNFPTTYAVDFSEPLLLPSIQAGDLTVNGTPALSVNIVDGNTLEFLIDPAVNLGDGIYTVEIAAGAVEDLQSTENIAYTGTFEFDTTGPVILSTSWNGLPLRFSRIYEEGPLTFEAQFNEDLFELASARRGPFAPGFDDVLLVDNITGTTVAPNSVDFDASTDLLTVSFATVPEGDYLLTLLSGDGSFEDRVGNDLDGEPLGPGRDGTVTGDGVNGGNYSISFSVDSTSTILNPFVRIEPFGSLVAQSADNIGYINSSGDQDLFAFFAEGGQNITAVVTPSDPAATLSVEMLGLGAPVVAAGPGLPVVLDSIPLPADATFQLRVSGDVVTSYDVGVWRNATAEAAVGDSEVGNELSVDSSFLALGSGRYAVVGNSRATPPPATVLENGSFETGDFSGWTTASSNFATLPWAVSSSGPIRVDLDPVQPQDGLFTAWHGYQGPGGTEFTIYQDVVLPTGPSSLELQWQDRVQWFVFGGLDPRIYDVEIRDPETGAVLDTLFSFNTHDPPENFAFGDSGWLAHTADLTAFAGQEVRIYFRQLLLDDNFGHAQFELDGVSLVYGAGAVPIDVDRYTIDLSSHVGQAMDFVLAGVGDGDFSGELLELLDDTGAVVATASAEPLAFGTAVENYDLGILDFVVPDLGSNIYTLQLTASEPGDYGLLATDDLIFDTEANNSTSSPIRNLDSIQTALGFLEVESTVNGVVEPDDFPLGTNLATAVPQVTLSVTEGGTVTAQSSFFPPTGSNVFGNDIFGTFWGESRAELRADFDAPADLVSIVVGSDDSSDRSYLRAFDASNNLLDEVLSGFLTTGQSETLTISRATSDIAYVTAAGLGGDITILDRLEFGGADPTLPGDLYRFHLHAGQNLTAFSEIPLLDHPLTQPLNDLNPELTISAPDGTILATDADSLDGRNARLEITAATSGDYYIRIGSTLGQGEYLLHIEKGPLPADFDGSGAVTGFDFLAWQRGFGTTLGATKNEGDSNGDGDVDDEDLYQWEQTFGEQGSAIPNPPLLATAPAASGPIAYSILDTRFGTNVGTNKPVAAALPVQGAGGLTVSQSASGPAVPSAKANGLDDALWAAASALTPAGSNRESDLAADSGAIVGLVGNVKNDSAMIGQLRDTLIWGTAVREVAIEQLSVTDLDRRRIDLLWDGGPVETASKSDLEDLFATASRFDVDWF